MNLEPFITSYGYWTLFIGTFFEGETILILGGFAAHRGYLSLPLVIMAAFLGTFVGDQFYFFIGRKKGKAFLVKRPSWEPNIERAQALLERYQTLLILGFRFIYGLRTVTPFVIGMSRVRTNYFIILNFISGVVWASVIGIGGYLFGAALEAIFENIRHLEILIFSGIIFVGLAVWMSHYCKKRRRYIEHGHAHKKG